LWPSTRSDPRPPTAEDSDVLFRLHRASLGVYVEEVYGPWDDEVQRLHHDRWLDTAHPEVIETSDGVVGVVDFAMTDDHAELGRISIHPDHQDHGLGLPVQLEVFDINPARRLYERLGFCEVWHEGRKVGMMRPAQPLG
jgi:ribosomal protein S18 acetylase RimI-like enzyme